jgi:peptidoglycan/LPS O-acetylase OafA/YrhL
VISYAHMRDFRTSSAESTRRFLKLRLARIYPAHFAVALLWLPLIGAAHLTHHGLSASVLQSFNPRTLGYALTLMNGWGLPASQGWNLPSWSVGSEWFAYLTFPLVAGGPWRIPTASGMMLIAATTLLLATALAIIVNGGHHYMLPESFTLVRVETEFLVGCCAYGIYCRLPPGSRATWLSWAGTSGCVALACSGRHGLLDGLFIPLFFLLILGLSYARGPLARMLALRASCISARSPPYLSDPRNDHRDPAASAACSRRLWQQASAGDWRDLFRSRGRRGPCPVHGD